METAAHKTKVVAVCGGIVVMEVGNRKRRRGAENFVEQFFPFVYCAAEDSE